MEAQIHQLHSSADVRLLRLFTAGTLPVKWTEPDNDYVTAFAHINKTSVISWSEASPGCLTIVQLGLRVMSALIKPEGNPDVNIFTQLMRPLEEREWEREKKHGEDFTTLKPSWGSVQTWVTSSACFACYPLKHGHHYYKTSSVITTISSCRPNFRNVYAFMIQFTPLQNNYCGLLSEQKHSKSIQILNEYPLIDTFSIVHTVRLQDKMR